MSELMSVKEVAEYLNVNKVSIYKSAIRGKLPGKRVGKVWRFDKKAVDKWVCGKWKADGADHKTHE